MFGRSRVQSLNKACTCDKINRHIHWIPSIDCLGETALSTVRLEPQDRGVRISQNAFDALCSLLLAVPSRETTIYWFSLALWFDIRFFGSWRASSGTILQTAHGVPWKLDAYSATYSRVRSFVYEWGPLTYFLISSLITFVSSERCLL